MEFVSWYVRRGRIDRRMFWLHYVLPIAVLSVLAFGVDMSFGSTNLPEVLAGTAAAVEYGPFTTAIGFLTIVPTLSSQATRLHDQGRSAWWLLLNLVPLFGQLVVLGLCGFVPSQAGPNRYGPPVAGGPTAPAVPLDDQAAPWEARPADRAPDYPPSDWR